MSSHRVACRSNLPKDSTLLPLSRGELLVSRSHATFCRIAPEQVAAVRGVLQGGAADAELPASLLSALETHGFFGPARPPQAEERSVQLQLTNACNLGCSYCCTNSGTARARELDRDRWFALVDEIEARLGTKVRIAILGGEPLMVPWGMDLAERVVERGFTLTLFTNGTPLRDEALAARAASLIRAGAQVRVSLAGPTRASCDSASGAERFDQAIEGLHGVARHGAKAIVDLMLLPDSVEETAEHLHALRGLLPPGTVIAFGILFHGGREQGQRVFASRSELESALDRIAFEAGESIQAPSVRPLANRREGCTCALGHHLHVRSDGGLFTCFKMEEQVGDLGRDAFLEVLERVRAAPKPAATLTRCLDCALATLCGGGCRSENLQLTGSADEPVCGPWRVRVLSELLAEDRVAALDWPAPHLLGEARARGIEAPDSLQPLIPSRHLIDT